jgi:hypothetical protein
LGFTSVTPRIPTQSARCLTFEPEIHPLEPDQPHPMRQSEKTSAFADTIAAMSTAHQPPHQSPNPAHEPPPQPAHEPVHHPAFLHGLIIGSSPFPVAGSREYEEARQVIAEGPKHLDRDPPGFIEWLQAIPNPPRGPRTLQRARYLDSVARYIDPLHRPMRPSVVSVVCAVLILFISLPMLAFGVYRPIATMTKPESGSFEIAVVVVLCLVPLLFGTAMIRGAIAMLRGSANGARTAQKLLWVVVAMCATGPAAGLWTTMSYKIPLSLGLLAVSGGCFAIILALQSVLRQHIGGITTP